MIESVYMIVPGYMIGPFYRLEKFLPYFDLPLCQVKISGKFPTLLLRDVGVEKKLFLQLEGLKL